MGTVKRNPFLAGMVIVLGGVMLVANVASAELGSDKAGAILVFPKVVADSAKPVDTEIQISNTADHQIAVRCYLVNANSHCSNAGYEGRVPLVCSTTEDCNPSGVTGGICVPGWNEQDFRFSLTRRQPIVWRLSEGMSVFPLDGATHVGPVDNDPNLPSALQGQPQVNIDSNIPPAPEDPFLGELKCVQVDLASEEPSPGTDPDNNFAGDLAGVATIVSTEGGEVDARSYNAIGIQAIADNFPTDNNTLRLGTDGQYDGCPSILIVDHFFDGAEDPAIGTGEIDSTLTLVPCSENFFLQNGGQVSTVAQFLIFNEFEQRLSTSQTVKCLSTKPLTDISNVYDVGVQGTLTGQTRIRAVDGNDPTRGDGLLGLLEESHSYSSYPRSAAVNLHQTGIRFNPDFIVLAPPQ